MLAGVEVQEREDHRAQRHAEADVELAGDPGEESTAKEDLLGGRSRTTCPTAVQGTYSGRWLPATKISMPAFPSPRSPVRSRCSSSPLWRVTLAPWAPRSSRPGGTIEATRPNGMV